MERSAMFILYENVRYRNSINTRLHLVFNKKYTVYRISCMIYKYKMPKDT